MPCQEKASAIEDAFSRGQEAMFAASFSWWSPRPKKSSFAAGFSLAAIAG
jgi:hypothetical protein